MAQITLHELSIGFRGPPLLDRVSCQIQPGERIGLLGRNGAGKSTLLGILCGRIEPDGGTLAVDSRLKVALLPQDVPRDVAGRVADVVAAGFDEGVGGGAAPLPSAWRREQQVEDILKRMGLDGAAAFDSLSAGRKRRALLARALVAGPDLLLLDEPTNHLDIESIDWLERFLERFQGTLIFVTHDRMFLRKLADRILELDRGRLFDWSCDYDTFLDRKEAALAAEEKQQALFDKRLAQEEAWIRRGIMARRTRNEGRVRALRRMREQRRQRRTAPGKVRMGLNQQVRSGNLVVDAEKIAFAYPGKPIFRDFSTTIMRGDKIGVVGPNGVGKTTLLRVLLGELPPTAGSIRLGTNLQTAYFDQLRGQLDPQATVEENVGQGSRSIRLGDKSRHVLGYLQDFLFTPEQARTPVRFLSGGERNRVLLARLFARPANVVVFDEPTNDLDVETLELLENLLVEYTGTVLLVSHDREFLNNVVTSTIVFEGDALREYVGGYDDWLRQRAEPAAAAADSKPAQKPRAPATGSATRPARRLTYKEKQELASLPERIEQLEAEIGRRHAAMAAADFYKRPGEAIAADTAALGRLEEELAAAFARWEVLEDKNE